MVAKAGVGMRKKGRKKVTFSREEEHRALGGIPMCQPLDKTKKGRVSDTHRGKESVAL